MGAITSSCFDSLHELKDRIQADESNNNPKNDDSEVHLLVIALDYPGTGNELTCTKDGDNIQALARQCGVQDMVVLYNNEGNKDTVIYQIRAMASRCKPDDYFMLYYSGHGTSVVDKDGDELDGKDEALCLVTPDGKLDWSKFLTDDELREELTSGALDADVNIVLMCDCCHSGTIGDFQNEDWAGYKAVSMSGCLDSQTSGDTGNGGIFTHSLLMALQELRDDDEEEFSIGQLYNHTLEKDDNVFNSAQEITVRWPRNGSLKGPQDLAWPLVPPEGYEAPWEE